MDRKRTHKKTKKKKRKKKKPLRKFPSLRGKVSVRLSHESSPKFPHAPPPFIQSGHTSWRKSKTTSTTLTSSFSHVPSIYEEFSSTISKSSFPLEPSSASFLFLLMGFHCRKLLQQQQHGHTIPPRGASYHSPAPSPSPHRPPLSQSLLPSIPFFHPFPDYDGDGPHNHIHIRFLQVAMIVLGCTFGVVLILCTMSVIRRRYYSRRHNHRRGGNTPILFNVNGDSPASDDDDDDDDGPIIEHPIWFIRTEGLQQSVIDSITVFTYRKDQGLIDGTECSVCLGEFQDDETLRLLPKCSHAFHIPCIDTWLRSHKNCPLCRAPVVHDASGGGGGGSVGAEVRATEPDLNVSGENQEMINTQMENFDGGTSRNHNFAESESSVVRIIGDDDAGGSGEAPEKVFPIYEKVNCHSSIVIGLHEAEEEMKPMRRSISMDSCAGSMMFHDVVDLNSDQESSDTQFGDKINSSSKDIMKVDKQGGGSSTTICKLASIGRVLQKRPISFRSSFSSHNRKSLSSRHCRSQSSTLPL